MIVVGLVHGPPEIGYLYPYLDFPFRQKSSRKKDPFYNFSNFNDIPFLRISQVLEERRM
jgi:hypothetical protein